MRGRIVDALRTHAWVVLEDDGHVVGYAYGGPFKARAAYRWSCEVGVHLAPDWRGRGGGRALYEVLLERLTRCGYRTTAVGLTLPDEAGARLRRSLGFEPVGKYRRIGSCSGRAPGNGTPMTTRGSRRGGRTAALLAALALTGCSEENAVTPEGESAVTTPDVDEYDDDRGVPLRGGYLAQPLQEGRAWPEGSDVPLEGRLLDEANTVDAIVPATSPPAASVRLLDAAGTPVGELGLPAREPVDLDAHGPPSCCRTSSSPSRRAHRCSAAAGRSAALERGAVHPSG